MTPSRKGFNPVKLPFAIKSSDRTFAAWANEVVTAIQQLRDRVPQSNVSRPSTTTGSRPPFWGTLSQVPDSDPAEYQVTFTLGYLTYQNAGASEAEQGVTGYIVPTINGVAMDSGDVEPLELPAVVSYVYLRVKTDADGVPKFGAEGGPVTIEAFDAPQESVHHVRPSPLSGEEEGDYFFLLLETEEIPDSDPAAPRVKRRLTGNRYLPNQLVEIENVGEGELDDENAYPIYKGYQVGPDDKHQLRTLKQIAIPENTEAARLLVPKEDGDDPGDSIKVKIIKKGNSASTPYTIQDEEESATIRMQGATTSEASVRKFSIDIIDGLVNSFTKEDTTGGNLNMNRLRAVETGFGSGNWSTEPMDTLYFRDGAFVGVADPDGGNPPGDLIERDVIGEVIAIA